MLTKNRLIVVNFNLPFKKVKAYNLSEISQIKIANTRWIPWVLFPFGIVLGHYVQVNHHKFYCAGLDVDGYHEEDQDTELTLDDLERALQNKGLMVHFKLG